MNYEKDYVIPALYAIEPYLRLLPVKIQRDVQLALSLVCTNGVRPDEVAAQVGSRNWVVARRTRRIVERYGQDVVCLSPKRYEELKRKAAEARCPDRAANESLAAQSFYRGRQWRVR